jgi:hypothetical protein
MQLNEFVQTFDYFDTCEFVRTSKKGNAVHKVVCTRYYHDTPTSLCEETWSWSVIVNPAGEVIDYTYVDSSYDHVML